MNWLENRVPPPLVAGMFAFLMWALSRGLSGATAVFPGQALTATLVLAIGLGVIAAAIVRFVRARTTVDPLHPEAASTLVTDGILRLTRNPMYLGMALILVAWAVWLGNAASALLVAGFIAYITRLQIAPEERALRARFGESFDIYARKVRRWL